ncbi:MAG: glycosyltransferase family 1 protein [Acidobacteria bacterium]|nr:MAG: glycosyltransferase family 1 protein [Acidobacteriota bacterium]
MRLADRSILVGSVMTSDGAPRVALFTDSYFEANGIARLSRSITASAGRRNLPFLCVYGGRSTRVSFDGPLSRLELRRSAAALRLEHDLTFDPVLWRHYDFAKVVLTAFRPDIVHITGPSDVGQLGALLGHRMHIPIVGSWHTNLHQYAAMRSAKWFGWMPRGGRTRVLAAIEDSALAAALLFYRIPRVLMAPNTELVNLLAERTGKSTYLMKHGVDCATFRPRAHDPNAALRIGFVGRLSAEKHVRLLATVNNELVARGVPAEFVVIGEGVERAWLQRAMPAAQFRGVLEGEQLAREYGRLDLFAFPSPSETFGLAVLEAMASGVGVLAMARGGPASFVEHNVSGWLAEDDRAFIAAAVALARDRARLARLGCGARTAAMRWSWDVVTDELYGVYRNVLH